VQPATLADIVTGGSRGDFVGVGPDKCLYATQSDEIEKVTAADGSCPFLPTGVAKPPSRYVALGDSYSSGEGTFNYFPNTDITANKCHRSPDAYPLVLFRSGQLGGITPSELDFGACSGATIHDFYNPVWNNEPPQLDVICTPKPYVQPSAGALAPCSDTSVQLVTLSVGGNDLGFDSILTACITNRQDQQRCLGQDPYVTFGGSVPEQDASCQPPLCGGDGQDPTYRGIERIENQYRQLLMDIRGRAPHARIVVLGYPRIFPAAGAADDSCHLNPTDQVWLISKDLEVDNLVRFAVNASGVAEYADVFSAVDGHEACQGLNGSIPWINGLVFHPTCLTGCDESFHPTPDGQKAIASFVAGQLVKSAPGPCGSGCTWLSGLAFGSTTFQVQVAAGTAVASFSTKWSGKDDVVMSITSPGGQVYSRSSGGALNHSNGDGFEYYNLPDGDPTLLPNSGVTAPSVSSGTWTVSLSTAAATPVAVTFQLGLSAQRDPTPKAEATFNEKVITTMVGPLALNPFAIVRFDAKPSSDLDGRVVTYSWNFGDGTTGIGAHVEHKYSTVGKFCPLLTVTDDSGQIGYASGKILVASDDPGDCI
jgi:lysophospholipase L1-like esterase